MLYGMREIIYIIYKYTYNTIILLNTIIIINYIILCALKNVHFI